MTVLRPSNASSSSAASQRRAGSSAPSRLPCRTALRPSSSSNPSTFCVAATAAWARPKTSASFSSRLRSSAIGFLLWVVRQIEDNETGLFARARRCWDMKRLALVAAAIAALALPAAASADTLITAAPGAKKLASGGGWFAWSAPNEDTGWHLVLRAPDGTVSTPQIDDFTGPVQVSIGSTAFAAGRSIVALYSRPSGGDQDIYELDLRTGRESRISPISSASYDETAPSMKYGRMSFVRSGGRHDGVYAWTGGSKPSRRLSSYEPSETFVTESRVTYPASNRVIVRRLSGDGRALQFASPSRPRSVTATRYRTAWLTSDGRVFQTPRYAGSGGPYNVTDAFAGDRALPPSTVS